MAFKVGDKVVPSDTKKWKDKSQYKIIDRVENKYDWNTYYIKGYPACWYDEELELFEGVEEMKELTFKEVIANIKEGEVWEGECRIIKCINSNISIWNKDGCKSDCFLFIDDYKFKLQRKEYTFEEAFKAYEEGKEVESRSWRYKKIHGKDSVCSKDNDEWVTSKLAAIDIKEIRGKWYIND